MRSVPKEIIILDHEQDISQRWSSVVKQRQFYVLHGLAEMGGQKKNRNKNKNFNRYLQVLDYAKSLNLFKFSTKYFFLRKLFQSTRLYIKGIVIGSASKCAWQIMISMRKHKSLSFD